MQHTAHYDEEKGCDYMYENTIMMKLTDLLMEESLISPEEKNSIVDAIKKGRVP
ncbi:MAG: hypothetical protein ACI4TK_06910 [Agathobacter sp.]